MNNKNIEEIIKEYMKEYPYTDVGVSCSALAGRIEEYYIKPNYTPKDKVQAEKEQYKNKVLDEILKQGHGGGNWRRIVEQFKKVNNEQ